MKTITITNKKELGDYLIETFGWANVKSSLDDLICSEAENGCSMKKSVRAGCELYYESELMGNEEEGFINLNISKKDILEVLEEITRG